MLHKWLFLVLHQYKLVGALTLILLNVNVLSYQSPLEVFEKFDNVRLVAFINESDIKNYPKWQALIGEPPLTVSQAIQAVKKFDDTRNIGKKNIDYANSIKKIELRQMSAEHKNYWHYLIKIKKEISQKIHYQVYVVLMNGKVIPAIIEPDSIK